MSRLSRGLWHCLRVIWCTFSPFILVLLSMYWRFLHIVFGNTHYITNPHLLRFLLPIFLMGSSQRVKIMEGIKPNLPSYQDCTNSWWLVWCYSMARMLGPGESQAFSLPKLGTEVNTRQVIAKFISLQSSHVLSIDTAIAGIRLHLRFYLSHPVIAVGDLWDVCSWREA